MSKNAKLDALLAAGLTKKQAKEVLAALAGEATVVADPKAVLEQAVEAAGFAYTSGRVYFGPDGAMIEAVVRVLKTGTPEIVATSGNGRTKAVQVTRTASGDASVQNLALRG
jgi:hypothetical protein